MLMLLNTAETAEDVCGCYCSVVLVTANLTVIYWHMVILKTRQSGLHAFAEQKSREMFGWKPLMVFLVYVRGAQTFLDAKQNFQGHPHSLAVRSRHRCNPFNLSFDI